MTFPVDLVLVRHGQSEGNVVNDAAKRGDDSGFTPDHMARHSSDWRLTDLGIWQAQRAGAWLADQFGTFDRWYVSPFVRCEETAAELGFADARWYSEPVLRERDWGLFDAMPADRRRAEFSEVLAARKKDPLLWTPPHGESIAEVDTRLHAFRDTLHRECSERRVIVVCHGEVMWAMRLRLERMSFDEWRRLDNSDDPHDEIHNCQVLHYTRRNPDDGEITSSFGWLRSVCPWDLTQSSNTWTPIVRRSYSSAELAARARSKPRLFAGPPAPGVAVTADA